MKPIPFESYLATLDEIAMALRSPYPPPQRQREDLADRLGRVRDAVASFKSKIEARSTSRDWERAMKDGRRR